MIVVGSDVITKYGALPSPVVVVVLVAPRASNRGHVGNGTSLAGIPSIGLVSEPVSRRRPQLSTRIRGESPSPVSRRQRAASEPRRVAIILIAATTTTTPTKRTSQLIATAEEMACGSGPQPEFRQRCGQKFNDGTAILRRGRRTLLMKA
jgi:hypothetical protein